MSVLLEKTKPMYVQKCITLSATTEPEDDDVHHRMNLSSATFSSLWPDHHLPVALKLWLYCAAVCSYALKLGI